MPDIFEDSFLPVFSNGNSFKPAVNIREDDKNYVLDFAIPGFDKKDLKIDMNEDVLTISSETKNDSEESKDGYRRKSTSPITPNFMISLAAYCPINQLTHIPLSIS